MSLVYLSEPNESGQSSVRKNIVLSCLLCMMSLGGGNDVRSY